MRQLSRTELIAVLLAVLLGVSGAFAGGRREAPAEDFPLQIVGAWAREVGSSGGNTGVYLSIGNPSQNSDRLLVADTDVARATELHTHIMDGGMARMRQVPEIVIPPNEIVELAPGGLHVMLIGVESPLRRGAVIDLTLTFEVAGTVSIVVPVRAAAEAMGH